MPPFLWALRFRRYFRLLLIIFLDISFSLPRLESCAGLGQRRTLVALNVAGKWGQSVSRVLINEVVLYSDPLFYRPLYL